MLSRFFLFVCFFLVLRLEQAPCEIQKVVIKWDAFTCLDTCIPLLDRSLRAIAGVTDVQINASAGIGEIHWQPQVPFSYVALNLAVRGAGIRPADVRLQVNGTIVGQGESIYLSSLGDNTLFLLLGPTRYEPGRYTIASNIANHPLSPALKMRLLAAQEQGQIVIIEGPLFEPNTARASLSLITEQVKIPPPSPDTFNKNELRMR